MPKHNVTLNLPGFTIKKTSGYAPIIHEIEYHRRSYCCHCGSKNLRKKDSCIRKIEHETVGLRRVLLKVKVNKYYCRNCKKYFRQRFEGILPWQRSTEGFKKQIYQLHSYGISRKDLGDRLRKSDSTISRYYDDIYELQDRKRLSMKCPEILGIDEHFFSRKQGYATTLCDLKKHRIFDVVLGKYESDLKDYLLNLPGREKVKVVCMDMSESYRTIVKKYFPNAQIVADRFHVIRLALHHLIKTCKEVDPALQKHPGITKLLRKHTANLNERQKNKLFNYLKNQPAIHAIYQFKEELMKILLHKKRTRKQCIKLIPQFLQAIEKLKMVGFEQCKTLARSLQKWDEEIVRMWRFSKTNGITEGFHRKMKLIQRRAFGFRNFQNYAKRVRVLCA